MKNYPCNFIFFGKDADRKVNNCNLEKMSIDL